MRGKPARLPDAVGQAASSTSNVDRLKFGRLLGKKADSGRQDVLPQEGTSNVELPTSNERNWRLPDAVSQAASGTSNAERLKFGRLLGKKADSGRQDVLPQEGTSNFQRRTSNEINWRLPDAVSQAASGTPFRMDPQLSTLNSQLSTLNSQLSTLNSQPPPGRTPKCARTLRMSVWNFGSTESPQPEPSEPVWKTRPPSGRCQ